MIDRWDAGFDDVASKPPARPPVYEVLPPGTHELEIVAASVGTVPWKNSDTNPGGQCLRLRLSAGRHASFVFADLPRDRPWLFKAFAASAGLEPGADGTVRIGPAESLIGRRVRVEVSRYTTRAGEARANVKRWLPASAATKHPQPSTRSSGFDQQYPAMTVHRTSAEDDAIPF
jgi:hypothetical protein